MEKSADAFRTISEVADLLHTPAHVLRFWESRFPQIKPVKRAGGRRYYRPSDIALLGGIRRLLHEDGLTIRGVQKILKEQGVRHVSDLGKVPEAAFVEVEADDTPHTAEVHTFPRRPAPQIDPELAGWTFTPSSPDEGDDVGEEDFFAASPQAEDAVDEAPPQPLSPSDGALARTRAERMRDPVVPVDDTASAPLILRLLAADPRVQNQAALRDMAARLRAIEERMRADETF
ncbi:MerR family transcriptional regulator [Falsirhodobacter halotolerans]|uniref:MerR family transcriptional regulator n=1 Tax=Falsirhodobacter halotolerans TaxID=1146892 RepID=UPI001FD51406|nr:MerR family transcriptional regulator [Falsirhodobacter halotolerans]MCJ8139745.1 MerR family transcriptional regulator [Falsirhodobacter halotolerans]